MVLSGDCRYLLWSDIPNNRIVKWRKRPAPPARSAANPPITRTEHPRPPGARRRPWRYGPGAADHPPGTDDGSVTVILDWFYGKPINLPTERLLLISRMGPISGSGSGLWNLGITRGEECEPNCLQRTCTGSTAAPAKAMVVVDDNFPNGCFSPDVLKLSTVGSRAWPRVDPCRRPRRRHVHQKRDMAGVRQRGRGSPRLPLRCRLHFGAAGGSEALNGVAAFAPGRDDDRPDRTPRALCQLRFGG